jgi:hypothetical protein
MNTQKQCATMVSRCGEHRSPWHSITNVSAEGSSSDDTAEMVSKFALLGRCANRQDAGDEHRLASL